MKKIFFLTAILLIAISFKAQNSNFNWVSTYKGGSSDGRSVAVDSQGSIYSVGSFQNTLDFKSGVGGYTLTSAGNDDVFITKTDSLGNLIWAKRIGSTYNDIANAVIVDHLGNIIIVGRFTSQVDFDPGAGVYNMTVINGMTSAFADAFILKLDANGNFIWAKQLNYNIIDQAYSICEDSFGNIIVAGSTYTSPSSSAFVAKLNSLGSTLWSKVFYSTNDGFNSFVDVDSQANIYCSGGFYGRCTFGTIADTLSSPTYKGFVCALGSNGQFKWVKQAGGQASNWVGSILKVDNNDKLFVTGGFDGTTIFGSGVGSFTLTSAGNSDIFITKMDTMGTFLWVKQIGSTSDDKSVALTLDSIGNQYISGTFNGTVDFDSGSGVNNLSSSQGGTFLLKLDAASNFVWANQIGMAPSVGSLNLRSLFIDRNNNLFSTGTYNGTIDFDASAGIYNLTSPFNNSNPFVLRMGNCMTPLVPTSSNQHICASTSTTLSLSGVGAISWYSSPTSTVALTSSPSYTISPLTAGTYTYYVESKICNVTSARAPIVYTVTLPAISVVLSATNVCYGNSATLTLSGANTYTLSGPSGITGLSGNTVTVTPPQYSVNDYTITGKDLYGCINTQTTSIFANSNPLPTLTIAASSSMICTGSSCTLSVTGANTYTWNNGSTLFTSVVSPTTNTTYSVFGVDVNGCNASKQYTVSVSTPYVHINGNSGICVGSSRTLTANGATSYTWNPGGIISNSIVVSPTVNTTYFVIGTASYGCLDSDSLALNVTGSNVSYMINPNPICAGSTATITGVGASTYTWNPGGITANNIVITPMTNMTYTMNTIVNICSVTKTISVLVNALPTLTITGTNTACLGTSSGFMATGATTYTWMTGQTTSSISVNPTVTTTYTAWGTDMNGCIDSESVTLTIDNTCADVWPGDANSDGTTDNLDVLELGLHYTQTGAARASVSNNWQSYFANNWVGTITNGGNLNHSDCNGDGTIDDNDTLAIFNNYGLTHTFKPAQTTTVNPQLSIVPDQPSVVKGTWGTASIYFGDATTTINNINGVAFTVDFDNTLIEPNSIWIEYQNSFIDVGQNLHFRKLDFANNKLFTASTHTVSSNVSGYGKIATLHYQISSSLMIDQVLNIGISQVSQSDASGIIMPLTSGAGTLIAIGANVGIKESLLNSNVLISPNPTNGLLNINFNSVPQNTKIELYNSIGALVLTETVSNKNNTINVSDLSSGIYFMKVLEGNKVVAVKKVVRE